MINTRRRMGVHNQRRFITQLHLYLSSLSLIAKSLTHSFYRLQVHLGSTTPNTVHHVTVTNPYPWMNLGDRKIHLTTNTRRRATSLKNRRCRMNRAHPNGVDLRPHQHLSPNTHLQETRPRSCLLTLSTQKWAGYHSIWRKRRARGAVLAVWLCDSFWMDGLLVSFNLSLSDFAFWITKRMLLITLTLSLLVFLFP